MSTIARMSFFGQPHALHTFAWRERGRKSIGRRRSPGGYLCSAIGLLTFEKRLLKIAQGRRHAGDALAEFDEVLLDHLLREAGPDQPGPKMSLSNAILEML
jgi:hypothetical protein